MIHHHNCPCPTCHKIRQDRAEWYANAARVCGLAILCALFWVGMILLFCL